MPQDFRPSNANTGSNYTVSQKADGHYVKDPTNLELKKQVEALDLQVQALTRILTATAQALESGAGGPDCWFPDEFPDLYAWRQNNLKDIKQRLLQTLTPDELEALGVKP